jgi:hypothetical protein
MATRNDSSSQLTNPFCSVGIKDHYGDDEKLKTGITHAQRTDRMNLYDRTRQRLADRWLFMSPISSASLH